MFSWDGANRGHVHRHGFTEVVEAEEAWLDPNHVSVATTGLEGE